MFDDLRQRMAAKRVRPGDGRPLERFRWWQLFTGRKLFSLQVGETAYAVDVRLTGKQAGDDGMAHLFVNGRHQARSRMPAAFPVAGGTIQVAQSTVGLKRAHYVTTQGGEYLLTPDPRSVIGRRLRFAREHRVLSRWIAAFSVVALVCGLGINLVQLLEPILGVPPIVERFGRFESPIDLPVWVNVALGAAATLGAVERSWRLRHNWLDSLGT
ncbi:hypothetical protein [Cryptosporangium arvum]|uniref:Uncharacterized protein n=1 Tax=Cryptosporangium arvum DSM 44712 TaxID=927661 RepID=A0A010YPV8_9ACTN|nr:hypothetical protein [Cryptosporangium arvum]EXG82215.1 hypothetical protein CryarDRAFT_3373 [Cryptosporangium arvum DSM 44712]